MKGGNENSEVPQDQGRRKLVIAAGGVGALAVLFGGHATIFYRSLGDPSASSPLYAGPFLDSDLQQAVETGFNHATEASDVIKGIDLQGKVIVMTGSHSGTGREAAKAMASAGASIIALTRDVDRAKNNLTGVPNIEVEYLDLLVPSSIDDFAEKFLRSGRPIHVLINSAAIMGVPLQHDIRGYERHFENNVLGHFQLTARLIPALERAGGARIVNLSSRGHRAGNVNFSDINFKRTEYSGMRAYAQTKTALSLLSVKEDALFREKGIRAFAVHPGAVPSTDLFAAGRVGFASPYIVNLARANAKFVRATHMTEMLNALRRPRNVGDIYKTVQQGGATTTWAATSQALNNRGGLYLEDCNVAVMVPNGSSAPFGVRPWALDKSAADRVWDICQEMTGVRIA
ncbi:SDR family NAD(P)-dependent oxidoreductase [Burkholderia gladioli]|uniref:SDR family NAD(P)-dependent oxidoreductase n=1 Tax=Burkholderia gladioli TaxID=28095 RepID=UPI002FE10B6E